MSSNGYNAVQQFDSFARYYDQFMLRLVNYPAWVDYVIKIFNNNNTRPKTILDLACGTGIPTILFAKKGFRVTGVDNSLPMLEVLKYKVAQTNYDVQTIHSDIRNFSLPRKVDAAVSLYDSINYLLTEQDLQLCFCSVAKNLEPGGIFTFDLNTPYCLENFWDNRETPRRVGDIYSIWRNSYDKEQRISTLKLTVFTNDGQTFEEIHQERGYSEMEVRRSLEFAQFTDIKFYAHMTFLEPVETTLRIMVVARKGSN